MDGHLGIVTVGPPEFDLESGLPPCTLGLGPHACLGKALSTMILTTMLASALWEFCVQSAPPEQPEVEPVGRYRG